MAYNSSTNTLVQPTSSTSLKIASLIAPAASITLSMTSGIAKPEILTDVHLLSTESFLTASLIAPALKGFTTTTGQIPTYNVTYNLAPKQVWGS